MIHTIFKIVTAYSMLIVSVHTPSLYLNKSSSGKKIANNCKLHKFVTTTSSCEKINCIRHASS